MRLLKVLVQAVMVEEVDGFLHERIAQAITIPASEWRQFASEGGTFDQNIQSLSPGWLHRDEDNSPS
ncbi:hypothetical protein ASF64_02085 [Arthrobacter sp. Leaf137]|nr:hypothetical protein ASF64_02085 [Arthrobacter sp. Leaf137]